MCRGDQEDLRRALGDWRSWPAFSLRVKNLVNRPHADQPQIFFGAVMRMKQFMV